MTIHVRVLDYKHLYPWQEDFLTAKTVSKSVSLKSTTTLTKKGGGKKKKPSKSLASDKINKACN
jgi:hypothetical protein